MERARSNRASSLRLQDDDYWHGVSTFLTLASHVSLYTHTHTHTHTHIYIYIYMCVCVCTHTDSDRTRLLTDGLGAV
jgi:hypothetical protein